MNIENLTGHVITFVNKENKKFGYIYPSEVEEPLRAFAKYTKLDDINGFPTSLLEYKVEAPDTTLKRLESRYEAIIVSKITADGLRKRGYKGTIYITGRKHYNLATKELLGVRELSLYN